ncbi:MAG: hypothetical protein ACOYB2_10790 [Limnohabitans sp.]
MSKQKRHGPQNPRRTWCLSCGRVNALRSGDGFCRDCRRAAPKMMPGQEPYTPEEVATLHALVADAALGDPGEAGEADVLHSVRNGPVATT